MLTEALEAPAMAAARSVGNALASGAWCAHDEDHEDEDNPGFTLSESYAYFRVTWSDD